MTVLPSFRYLPTLTAEVSDSCTSSIFDRNLRFPVLIDFSSTVAVTPSPQRNSRSMRDIKNQSSSKGTGHH